jgi:hypothetical protein
MMTQICEPTHLSMSSADSECLDIQQRRFNLTEWEEVFERHDVLGLLAVEYVFV